MTLFIYLIQTTQNILVWKTLSYLLVHKSSSNTLCSNMNRFTNEQIREINDAFEMFDKDRRGFIKSQDLREMLKLIGYNPTDKVYSI